MKKWLLFASTIFVSVALYGQESQIAMLPPPTPASAPAVRAPLSLAEMEQRLSLMEETLTAYQDQVEQLRAEMKTLKSSLETAGREVLATNGNPTQITKAQNTSVELASAASAPTLPLSAAPAAAPAPLQTAGPTSSPMEKMVESVMPGLKLSGVIWLYDYKPYSLPGTRSSFDLYGFHLKLDRDIGPVGFHLEYRMRTSKLRSFFTGPTWSQEAYLKVKAPGGVVKVGEIYKQFGIFTDYGFYGGLPYFDGLKYDPEWGASYEGNNKLSDRVSIEHDLQYFRTDARVNGSFPGRDVVSDPTGRRRNEFVARLVPHIKTSDKTAFSFGPSFERGQVSRNGKDVNDYWRVGGEATFDIGKAKLYGEVIRQDFSVPRFGDLPKVTYGTAGINWDFSKWVSTHLNYGQGNYDTIGRRKEEILQPGLAITLGKGYAVYLEYTYWLQRNSAHVNTIFDRSLNTAFYISF